MDALYMLGSFKSAWSQISPLIFNLLAALIILLIGFLVGRGLDVIVTYILKFAQLDKAAKQVRFNAILEKAEIKKTASELLGDLIYWIVMFVTVIGAAKLFGLPIDTALVNLFMYLGLVMLAAIVLGIGLFFASLMSGIVKMVGLNFGLEGARTLSRVVYYIVVILTFLAALSQLGIKPDVFVPQIGVIIGAVGLAAAIAFGLGCKDMAADFLHNLFKGK